MLKEFAHDLDPVPGARPPPLATWIRAARLSSMPRLGDLQFGNTPF